MDISMSDHPASSAGHMVDGFHAETLGDSPASSTGAPGRPRSKQVPISRNAASGYERPERARTSHACEPCRERKTKCDGERPSCRRCLHTGTGCHYGYGKGWKKRKTAEDLTVTSRKLARYEELLVEIFPLVSDDVRNMIDEARQQEYAPLSPNEPSNLITPSVSGAIDTELRIGSPPTHTVSLPTPISLTQSAPPLLGVQLPLPPPSSFDASQSPRQMQSTPSIAKSARSPTGDSPGNPATRLPSITRHGYLVDGELRSVQPLGSFASGVDPMRVVEQPEAPGAIRNRLNS